MNSHSNQNQCNIVLLLCTALLKLWEFLRCNKSTISNIAFPSNQSPGDLQNPFHLQEGYWSLIYLVYWVFRGFLEGWGKVYATSCSSFLLTNGHNCIWRYSRMKIDENSCTCCCMLVQAYAVFMYILSGYTPNAKCFTCCHKWTLESCVNVNIL